MHLLAYLVPSDTSERQAAATPSRAVGPPPPPPGVAAASPWRAPPPPLQSGLALTSSPRRRAVRPFRSPASRRRPRPYTPPPIGTYTPADAAAAIWDLTESGGSPPADPLRPPPTLSWCTWRNQRRRRTFPCRRPPAAIGPPLTLTGCPPGSLQAPRLPPASPLGSLPSAPACCIYRINPTLLNKLFVLAHVAPLSRLSLLIHVGVRVSVQPTTANPPLAAA